MYLASGSFDEICTCHHTHKARFVNIPEGGVLAGGKDSLQVRIAASLPHGLGFFVQSLPVSGDDVLPCNDDINLSGAIGDSRANF